MPFYNYEKASKLHAQLSPLSHRQLACTIIAAAKRLNQDDYGAATEEMPPSARKYSLGWLLSPVFNLRRQRNVPAFDAQQDADTVAAGLLEIATRTIDNRYASTDVFLSPIIKALKYAQDLSDGKEAATLLKGVTLPGALPQGAVGLGRNINPFSTL